MLVLSRKKGETIKIGNDITITIVKCGMGNVRIGVDAPSHVEVHRSEIAARIKSGPKEGPERGESP